jgi:NAD(P)-dependent dehydrogenase (short-subunit alcohol dehydrogenase family)
MGSRNVAGQQQVADDLKQQGYDVAVLELDQGEETSILAARDRILAESGQIDILVNNAVARPMRSWSDDAACFAESMRINATGVFLLTRAIGDEMARRRSGSIIQVGSIQGLVGPDRTLYDGLSMNGFIPDYFFHKGGLINFTRMAAAQYGPSQVRCNCVCPGGLRSPEMDEEFARRYSERTLLGRLAGPQDLMGIIVFLASDASCYLTGVSIPVDGGYTAK